MNKKIIVGVFALGLSSIALASGEYVPAAPAFIPNVYLGLQAGYGNTGWGSIHFHDFQVTDNDAFAGRVFLGYQFHPNFSIETGFSNFFNNPKFEWNNVELGKAGETYAIDLMGKIQAPIVDNFGLYAKAGGVYMNNYRNDEHCGKYHDFDYYLFNNHEHESEGTFNVAYGVGAYYDITPNITADLSWLRFNGDRDINEGHFVPYADLFTLGVMYKFNLS
jgi:opacity protein-like surface antigen